MIIKRSGVGVFDVNNKTSNSLFFRPDNGNSNENLRNEGIGSVGYITQRSAGTKNTSLKVMAKSL